MPYEYLTHVNLNITLMDLPCEYATVHVMSVFGGKQLYQNNTFQNIQKYSVDQNQVRQGYMHPNEYAMRGHLRKVTATEVILRTASMDLLYLTLTFYRTLLGTTASSFVVKSGSRASCGGHKAGLWEHIPID